MSNLEPPCYTTNRDFNTITKVLFGSCKDTRKISVRLEILISICKTDILFNDIETGQGENSGGNDTVGSLAPIAQIKILN